MPSQRGINHRGQENKQNAETRRHKTTFDRFISALEKQEENGKKRHYEMIEIEQQKVKLLGKLVKTVGRDGDDDISM